MKRLLLILAATGALAMPAVADIRHSAQVASATHHCGSFKFGLDGLQPGPGGITVKNETCWYARAVVLLGPPPHAGWRFVQGTGLLGKYVRGNQVIAFYGE
jgi:hypothetical protein